MKKLLVTAIMLTVATMILWSQVPQAMTYKAMAKDEWGVALPSKYITLRFSIIQGSETGTIVYRETQGTTTNKFGLIDVQIGNGTPDIGILSSVEWGQGPYYIQIEMDTKGGTDFRLEDPPHQLLSVPYALYAGSSEDAFSGYYFDLTGAPVLSTVALSGSYNDLYDKPSNLSQFTNDLTFLTEEVDPMFSVHPVKSITGTDITNWNSAFSWGNHSGLYRPAAYVPAWSEITDNPFSINLPEANQLIRYNSGIWENWTPDYLTTEIDGSVTNEIQTLSIDGQELTISDGNTITIPDEVDDADPDPGNELITDIILNGTVLEITEATVLKSVDLGSLLEDVNLAELENRVAQLEAIVAGLAGTDNDGDGFTISEGDCNDADSSIYPGAPEICGDGIDQDCDGIDLECGYPCITRDMELASNYFYSWILDLPTIEAWFGLEPGNLTGGLIESLVNGLTGGLVFDNPGIPCYDILKQTNSILMDHPQFSSPCGDYIETHYDYGIPYLSFECFHDNYPDEYSDYIEIVIGEVDYDEDGFIRGPDCDDLDPLVYPGAPEICGDGIDQDCDGSDLVCSDNDGDGYSVDEGDCDDTNPYINPAASEVCNDNLDNNCDGIIDEGCSYLNLLQNGDFEDWGLTDPIPNYWILEGPSNMCSQSNDAIHGNSSLMLLDNSTSESVQLKQDIFTITPTEILGKKLILSIWAKKAATSGPGAGYVSILDGVNSTEFALPENTDWQSIHMEHIISNYSSHIEIKISPTSVNGTDAATYIIDWGEIFVE